MECSDSTNPKPIDSEFPNGKLPPLVAESNETKLRNYGKCKGLLECTTLKHCVAWLVAVRMTMIDRMIISPCTSGVC